MTPRERMLTAMTGGIPDRVPCSPDTNWTIPARQKGRPFWEVYFENDPPIWKAYNECVRHFGIDGFSHHGVYDLPLHPACEQERRIVSRAEDRIVVETRFRCPAGELTQEETFLKDEPPTTTKKWLTDFASQHECLPYLFFGDVDHIRFDTYREIQADMGEDGVVGLCLHLPTLLTQWRQPVESAFYDYYDHHDRLTRFVERWADHLEQVARAVVAQDLHPDFVFFPNSGMVTMQSEDIMREVSLPALKRVTRVLSRSARSTGGTEMVGDSPRLVSVTHTHPRLPLRHSTRLPLPVAAP